MKIEREITTTISLKGFEEITDKEFNIISADDDSNSIEIDSELWNKLPKRAQELLQENGFKCICKIY